MMRRGRKRWSRRRMRAWKNRSRKSRRRMRKKEFIVLYNMSEKTFEYHKLTNIYIVWIDWMVL